MATRVRHQEDYLPQEMYPGYRLPGSEIHEQRDYADFVKTISAQFREIAEKQSTETRQHMDRVKAEIIDKVKEGNLTITDCIRYNFNNSIQTISIISAFASGCSIFISSVINFHIINPFVATFALIASVGFFIMTKFEIGAKK